MRKRNKQLEHLKHQVKRNQNKKRKLLAEQSDPSEDKSEIKDEQVEHHSHILQNYIGISNVVAFICLMLDGLFAIFFDKSNPTLSITEISISTVALVICIIISVICWRRS